MAIAALVLTGLVAVLHLLFMYMETIGWPKMGRRMGLSKDEVATTRTLAANQGAYNGGIGLLLIWAMATGNDPASIALLVFIAVMGIIGALTASKTIIIVQTLPALAALTMHIIVAMMPG
ncbi:MAG: putative membrane protein [Kiritimatiellia bacterium]|jgi:putative membrane protein